MKRGFRKEEEMNKNLKHGWGSIFTIQVNLVSGLFVQQEWEENFIRAGEVFNSNELEALGCGFKEDVFIYIDYGNIDPYALKIKVGYKGTLIEEDAFKIAKKLGFDEVYHYETYEDWTVSKDYLPESLIDGVADRLGYIDTDGYGYGDLEEAVAGTGIELVINLDDYEVIGTRGYGQGDSAEVIIPVKALEKARGASPNISEVSTEIGHLFWDSTLSARIIINDEEFYYEEVLEDRYVGDYEYQHGTLKEDIIQWVLKEAREIRSDWDITILEKELRDAMPQSIEYAG